MNAMKWHWFFNYIFFFQISYKQYRLVAHVVMCQDENNELQIKTSDQMEVLNYKINAKLTIE